MEFKRRDFLQAAGVWLAGVSSGELILQWGNPRGLAATVSSRRRALLIGINHYGPGEALPPLQGCLTDVELQKQLLHYRLAWDVADIHVLTNQGATGTAMQTAIQDFLLAGATSGDVLLLHFSGYGRQVAGLGATLIPYDVQADGSQDVPLSWLSQIHLPPGVTFWCCFDSGFQVFPGSPHRARPPIGDVAAYSLNPPSGMIWLQPTIAREIPLLGTQAGAFTQSLTKQLWSNTATSSLGGYWAAQDLERQTGELIHLHWQAESGARIPGTLNLNSGQPSAIPGADAAVVSVSQANQTTQVWLGGVARSLLTQAGWQSYFQPLGAADPEPQSVLLVQNPAGLLANSANSNPNSDLSPGTLLQERFRLLPHHLTLSIGLADTLDKVTRIDAVSGLAGFTDWVSSTADGPGDFSLIARSDAEHCLYGLAWPGGTVLPQTLGPPGEAIKGAVRRLGSTFPVLLANKWLNLTLNGATSGLGVTVAWEKLLPQPELLLRVQTERAMWPAPDTALGNFSAQAWERGVTFQVGEQFCYRLTNYSPDSVYALWLAWDSAAGLLVLPTFMDAPQLSWQLTLAPHLTTTLPTRELRYSSPCVNSYLLLSRTPFTQALAYLDQLPTTGDPPRLVPPKDAWPLVQAILQDLHQTPPNPLKPAPSSAAYLLDLQAWATFCFTFRVV